MKKTFLLLFAVASLVATAQPDYRPMLCEGRVWNEHAGAGLTGHGDRHLTHFPQ